MAQLMSEFEKFTVYVLLPVHAGFFPGRKQEDVSATCGYTWVFLGSSDHNAGGHCMIEIYLSVA